MTSRMSAEEMEDVLVEAGLISPHIRAYVMRQIETYARRFTPDVPFPPDEDMRGYKYKCPACGERKYLGEYPEYKKVHTRAPVPCRACLDGPDPHVRTSGNDLQEMPGGRPRRVH